MSPTPVFVRVRVAVGSGALMFFAWFCATCVCALIRPTSAVFLAAVEFSEFTSAGVFGLKAPDRNEDAAETPPSASAGCASINFMMASQVPGAGVVGWDEPGLAVVAVGAVEGALVAAGGGLPLVSGVAGGAAGDVAEALTIPPGG